MRFFCLIILLNLFHSFGYGQTLDSINKRVYAGYDNPVTGQNLYLQVSFPLSKTTTIGGGIKYHFNPKKSVYGKITVRASELLYGDRFWQKWGPQLTLRQLLSQQKIFQFLEPWLFCEAGYWNFSNASLNSKTGELVIDSGPYHALDLNLGVEMNIDISTHFFFNSTLGLNAMWFLPPRNSSIERLGGDGGFYGRIGLGYKFNQ